MKNLKQKLINSNVVLGNILRYNVNFINKITIQLITKD